jgi:hypothetical protein
VQVAGVLGGHRGDELAGHAVRALPVDAVFTAPAELQHIVDQIVGAGLLVRMRGGDQPVELVVVAGDTKGFQGVGVELHREGYLGQRRVAAVHGHDVDRRVRVQDVCDAGEPSSEDRPARFGGELAEPDAPFLAYHPKALGT